MLLNLLKELKDFDKDRYGNDELVALSAWARVFRPEYELTGGEVPDWVDRQIKVLRREIHARQSDALEARLAKAKARLASLATPEERRTGLKAEIDEIEATLRAQAGGK